MKIIRWTSLSVGLFIVLALLFPTWTPGIQGERAISTLGQVDINGAGHEVMIRGADRNNPILIFVHGGPGCSEIPYVRKYQDSLEQDFTIVHYDQRGSGKSYHFFEDYSTITSDLLVKDLLALTDYVTELLEQDQVILAGHSYGTYIGMQAAAEAPEKFKAYIGIGQVADHDASELDSFAFVLKKAAAAKDKEDVSRLEKLRPLIESGEERTPRGLIRKYGGAARLIDDNGDYIEGFIKNREYNLLDIIRYSRGIAATQERLLREEKDKPITELVRSLSIPCYFVMGTYDYMTSAKAAKSYFDVLEAPVKSYVEFEHSAHYPQFEEEERFADWMRGVFLNGKRGNAHEQTKTNPNLR
ncbi:alpha/beta hydrolase [Paenibacillus nanensis]|uniref:prolyl aminopeptidase n=1 Tax=Paenibacillus nanensis TaxID=393251 RepID=A0A3A1UZQ4_9BACL|nr:alpha/beta hydrolase [Paenibacillus nanensis]RIX53968.1 alpha/beta hydrolase [Paenibacillus nanensis]